MMNRNNRAFRPCAIGLESRIALSAASPRAEVARLAVVRPPLAGTLTGGYLSSTRDNRAADEPLTVGVNAEGRVHGLSRSR